jgi:NADH:ubiquinone oxidoreductase subunit 6 (subunit J)
MILVIIAYFGALAYFLFKLIRMYAANDRRKDDYLAARKSLTSFAVLTILLLVVTIITACVCTHNFNKGLKPHVNGKKIGSAEDGKAGYGNEMPSLSGPGPSQRMEID